MKSKAITTGILRAIAIIIGILLLGYFLYTIQSVIVYIIIAAVLSLIGRPLILFLIGVYFGKVITLYFYGKFSHGLKSKMENITTRINRIIGVLLTCISIFQFTKLFYFNL